MSTQPEGHVHRLQPVHTTESGTDTNSHAAPSVPNFTTICKRGQGQQIYLANGRIAGEIRDGVVFQKHIRNFHVLRKPPALAIDVELIDRLEKLGVEKVCIFNDDTSAEYVAPLDYFRKYGFSVNRGYGQQVGLLLTHFSQDNQDSNPPSSVQLDLFGGDA